MDEEERIQDVLDHMYYRLNGSMYIEKVEIDGEILGIISWDGGHGLHFWDLSGREIEYRTFGDFSQDETLEHAQEEIRDWIEEIRQEMADL